MLTDLPWLNSSHHHHPIQLRLCLQASRPSGDRHPNDSLSSPLIGLSLGLQQFPALNPPARTQHDFLGDLGSNLAGMAGPENEPWPEVDLEMFPDGSSHMTQGKCHMGAAGVTLDSPVAECPSTQHASTKGGDDVTH